MYPEEVELEVELSLAGYSRYCGSRLTLNKTTELQRSGHRKFQKNEPKFQHLMCQSAMMSFTFTQKILYRRSLFIFAIFVMFVSTYSNNFDHFFWKNKLSVSPVDQKDSYSMRKPMSLVALFPAVKDSSTSLPLLLIGKEGGEQVDSKIREWEELPVWQ